MERATEEGRGVHGAGLQLGLYNAKEDLGLTLRWVREFEARNRFQGDFFQLAFALKF